MSKIKLGLIGAGTIAEEHLKVIDKISDIKAYGITSRTNKNCQNLANKYKINKVYNSYFEMTRDHTIDAFLVLVSADQIYKVLDYLIPIKKPFFTEKPPGLNFNQTKKLSLKCKKYKSLNMVGFNRRFYSIFQKGKKIIENHGELLGISIEGHERYWLLKKEKNKTILKNWIYANSVHTIDLVRFFGGEIKKINSFSSKFQSRNKNNYISNFQYKSGVIGSYQSFWYSPGSWSVRLYGIGLTVEFNPLENGHVIFKNSKMKKIYPDKVDIKFKPGFYNQMLSFRNLILKSRKEWPIQDINDSLKTISLIKQISNEL